MFSEAMKPSGAFCIGAENRGYVAMSSIVEFLRRQAGDCARWARECFDLDSAKHFRLMAKDFSDKADEIERRERGITRHGSRDRDDQDGYLDA
jgi:hypothetical protein